MEIMKIIPTLKITITMRMNISCEYKKIKSGLGCFVVKYFVRSENQMQD